MAKGANQGSLVLKDLPVPHFVLGVVVAEEVNEVGPLLLGQNAKVVRLQILLDAVLHVVCQQAEVLLDDQLAKQCRGILVEGALQDFGPNLRSQMVRNGAELHCAK